MTRAAQCDECKHFNPRGLEEGNRVVCRKGHKPRFYLPKTMMQAIYLEYGYRRRCEDYESQV